MITSNGVRGKHWIVEDSAAAPPQREPTLHSHRSSFLYAPGLSAALVHIGQEGLGRTSASRIFTSSSRCSGSCRRWPGHALDAMSRSASVRGGRTQRRCSAVESVAPCLRVPAVAILARDPLPPSLSGGLIAASAFESPGVGGEGA